MKKFLIGFAFWVFISLSVCGQNISWIRVFDPVIRSMAVDNTGVLLTGEYSLITDFDPGPGVVNLSTSTFNNWEAYLLEISSAGDFVSVLSTENQGTSSFARPYQIETYGSGKKIIAGELYGKADFDPGGNSLILEHIDSNCSNFSDNSLFVWGLHFDNILNFAGAFCNDGIPWANSGMGAIQSISTFSEGFTLTGVFEAPADFDLSTDVNSRTPFEYDANEQNNPSDVFVARYDQAGILLWLRVIGGKADQVVHASEMDVFGNVYISGHSQAGFFSAPTLFDNNTLFAGNSGEDGNFLLKINPFGEVSWVKYFSNSLNYSKIALDSDGNIYATGAFYGTRDVDPGPGEVILNSGNHRDIFVLRFFPNGDLFGAFQIGHTDYPEEPLSLEVDSKGDLYLAGFFRVVTDLNPNGNSFILNGLSGEFFDDTFIAKYNPINGFSWGMHLGNTGTSSLNTTVKVAPTGEVYVMGGFSGEFDFDPGSGTNILDGEDGKSYVIKFRLLPSDSNEPDRLADFGVFPNPARRYITLELPQDIENEQPDYEIRDILGEMLLKGQLSGQNNTIDVSALPVSTYIIEVQTGKSKATRRFVKI